MKVDAEGFLHPQINPETCSDCDLCRTICPVKQKGLVEEANEKELIQGKPLNVFAAWHLDEDVRRESSSGGVFTALANVILADGGVVIGAAFDDNLVVRHILIEESTDLHRLRGSKYVQSDVSPAIYHRIHELLTQGRKVFFSGTPCQVAAIRSVLRKPYDNLFCCDIVCHGVPSPKVLDAYKTMLERQYDAKAQRIAFRRKDCGWKRYSVSLSFNNNTEYRRDLSSDPFMLGFLKNFCLRPSCYRCRFASIMRPGDLTIADFWGVVNKYPEYDTDDKGTSLVLVNTKKGHVWLDACAPFLFLGLADIETAILGNQSLVRPCMRPPQRDTFYHDLDALSFNTVVQKYQLYMPSFFKRIMLACQCRIKGMLCLMGFKWE